VRNLHVSPTGPTIVEALDVDYIRADYSLWDWMQRGPTELLKGAEVRTARIVLDPAKASLKPKIPPPDERLRLFPMFPERLLISDVSLLVRSTTEKPDFVLQHFSLALDPKNPGELRAAILQIPNADAWRNISATTSYTNKNLVISGLKLDEQNQIRLIAFDASHIAGRSLEVVLDASLAGGTVAGSLGLRETADSLNTKLRLVAENVSLDTLRGYLGRPPEFLAGDVERLGDRFADAHARVEGRMRILEDELQARPHGRQATAPIRSGDVTAEQPHRAAGGLIEPDQDAAGGRLARSRFADESQRLAFADIERKLVQHLLHHRPAAGTPRAEGHVEVADLDQGMRGHQTAPAARLRGVQRTR